MNTTARTTFIGTGGMYRVDEEINGSYIASRISEKFYISKLLPDRVDTVKRMLTFPTVKRVNGLVENRILWPREIIEDGGEAWCVMKIENYKSFFECNVTLSALLKGHISVKPAAMYRICANVTEVYSLLSSLDLYFNIYSLDDIAFDLKSGDICIKNTHMLLSRTPAEKISGTPLFMAPETVEGISGITRLSNIHSCLTYLFCLIYRVHPLHSAKSYSYTENILPDANAIREIYGFNAEFCFLQSQNALSEAAEALGWKETDSKVRELFTTLYTQGIKEPKTRPTLQSANAAFTEAAKSFPSTSAFSFFKPVSHSFTVLQPRSDAAKKVIISNISMDCRMQLGDSSLITVLNNVLGAAVSIENRGDCFILKNNTPSSLTCYIGSSIMCTQVLPGGEIELTRDLIIELSSGSNNITTLKFI